MAKYETPFEDTQLIFKRVIDGTGLARNVSIKILTNNKLKQIGKVTKTNPLVHYLCSEDIIIELNESVFEHLTDLQKIIVAESLVAYIQYDLDKDKLVIGKPDVIGHSGVISKFGQKVYLNLLEVIKEIYNQRNDQHTEKEPEAVVDEAIPTPA